MYFNDKYQVPDLENPDCVPVPLSVPLPVPVTVEVLVVALVPILVPGVVTVLVAVLVLVLVRVGLSVLVLGKIFGFFLVLSFNEYTFIFIAKFVLTLLTLPAI